MIYSFILKDTVLGDMTYYIKGVVRYAGRDIIIVRYPNDKIQPYYCSTGFNSDMKGTWLPFDGIAYNGSWFHKRQFVENVPMDYYRFGTSLNKRISEELGKLGIHAAEEQSWQDVNEWLKSHGARLRNE